MSFYEPAPLRTPLQPVDPDRVVKFGVGVAAAPLWAAYFTCASAGMAYWWMTAWTRREPKSFAPALRVPAIEPAPAAPEIPTRAAPEPEPVEAVIEAAVEAAVEAALVPTPPEPAIAPEAAPSAVAEPVVEAAPATEAAAETTSVAAPAAGPEPSAKPGQAAAAAGHTRSGAQAAAKQVAARKQPPVPRRPEPKKH